MPRHDSRMQQGWERSVPFLQLEREELEERLRAALPSARVRSLEPLGQGLRNTNYRVMLDGRDRPVVARFFMVDPLACPKEAALSQLLADRAPIPRVLGIDSSSDPPLLVTEWMEGAPMDAWLPKAGPTDVRDASRSAGSILAAIHSIELPAAGFLGPDLGIAEPFRTGGAGWAEYMRMFLFDRGVGSLLGEETTTRLWTLVQTQSQRLDVLAADRRLVHADYKPPNLLVRPDHGAWKVTGVLDWEFAFSGPPLLDIGLFLRFEDLFPPTYREGFVEGYVGAGGELPADWRDLARLLDLLSMCSLLNHTGDRGSVVNDVRGLILDTVERVSPSR